MSSKAMSPGAHLLRHSRLLSLPPPIPPPTAYTSLRSGKTFPTQQAISTPSSSHSRGDWGLKRNLPLKVTQKYLKYNELDTIEHRTTFESAHGEVMALRRWQEMDIPLTLPSEGGQYGRRRSAFDEIDELDAETGQLTSSSTAEAHGIPLTSTDETLSPSARRAQALKNHPTARQNASLTKWRYESPYLQNLPPRALRAWLLKKVRPRREEFITFLKRNEYLQASSKLSSGAPNHEPTAKDLADIKIDLAKLRNDPLVLESLITAFLDLPKNSPPPATHPSAGLQYTRSTAYMPNHPYTGPDNGPGRSFPGRQFQSRWQTLAGIAGLVAKVTAEMQTSPSGYGPSHQTSLHELPSVRDNRETAHWYRPLWATIDPDGSVALEVYATAAPVEDFDGPGATVAKPFIEAVRENRKAEEERLKLLMQQREAQKLETERFQQQNRQYTNYNPLGQQQQQQQNGGGSGWAGIGYRHQYGGEGYNNGYQNQNQQQQQQQGQQWQGQQQQQQPQYEQPQYQQQQQPQQPYQGRQMRGQYPAYGQQAQQQQQHGGSTPVEDVLGLLEDSSRNPRGGSGGFGGAR